MIFTFYSYKGGVGRSMALANAAAWLRLQGLRVAMIDWDLEAPGLESFFFESPDKLEEFASQVGLIDTLLSYKRIFPKLQKPLDEKTALEEKIAVLEKSLPPLASSLCRIDDQQTGPADHQPRLFTAGLRAANHFTAYAQNVQTFDWNDFYLTYAGHAYFEWMRRQLLAEADVVLIDSRTGLNEMSGICAQQLADVVVSFCAPNLQNLNGIVSMAQSFSREELVRGRGGRRVEMVIVPTRIDSFNPEKLNQFEDDFGARTDEFTPAILKTLKTVFWTLRLPYAPAHSYREGLIIGKRDADKGLEEAYKRLVVYLAMLAQPQSALRRQMAAEIERVIGTVLPRVFVMSGPFDERLAGVLRRRIEAANIKVWPAPDRSAAATDPRTAINGILEQTRVLVVPVTAEALHAAEVREVWRRARQLGVRILPVSEEIPSAELLAALPGWMRTSPFLVLDRDWEEIQTGLNTISPALRVPFMAPALADGYVPRSAELAQLKTVLLADAPPSTRVALYGAPGSGKTAIAKAFANDDEVQSFFTDGILWVNAHQGTSPQDELAKVYLAFTGEKSTFTSAGEIWGALQSRLTAARCLIVLDDLEGVERLRDFGWLSSCRYLITTRDRRVAAMAEATPLEIRSLDDDQAREILAQAGSLSSEDLERLIALVGTLPLSLKIASANIATAHTSSSTALSFPAIARQAEETLTDLFKAVLDRLEPVERERAADLAFSVADGAMTVDDVSRTWQIDPPEALKTLTRLADLALVSIADDRHTVELHPYARRIIAATMPERDLNTILDAAFTRIPAADAERARRVLSRLVRVNELSDIEPRTIRASELPIDQRAVLDQLQRHEIVVLGRDASGEQTVALARAAACRQWQWLRSWVETDREFLGWRQRLGAYVSNWQRATEASSLLRGTLLAEAVDWQKKRGDELSETEQQYIDASRAAARPVAAVPVLAEPVLAGRAAGASPGRRPLVLGALGFLAVAVIGGFWWSSIGNRPSSGAATLPSVTENADVIQGDLFASRGDQLAAIRSYTAALTRLNRDPDVYYKRGLAYAHNAIDSDKAIADFDLALALAPDRADVLAARGAARLAQNNADGALVDLNAAIARDPKNAQAYYSRAGARAARNDRPGAIEDYSTAIKLAPLIGNAYFGRAGAYENAGNTAAAVADLQQVVKLSTDPLDVRAAQARLTRLGSPATNEPATVSVHFQNPADSPVADEVSKVLSQRGFRVATPQLAPPKQATTNGDVRFVSPDRATALSIGEIVQDTLADKGFRLQIRPIALSPASTPDAKVGRVDVWLPSLSAPAKLP